MARANLSTLLQVCQGAKSATASDGSWTARTTHVLYGTNKPIRAMVVRHHGTDMMAVTDGGEVLPMNPGWGKTDVQGIGKILRGYGITLSYRDVFPRDWKNQAATLFPPKEMDAYTYDIESDLGFKGKLEEPIYERFVPPISVQDTIG